MWKLRLKGICYFPQIMQYIKKSSQDLKQSLLALDSLFPLTYIVYKHIFYLYKLFLLSWKYLWISISFSSYLKNKGQL